MKKTRIKTTAETHIISPPLPNKHHLQSPPPFPFSLSLLIQMQIHNPSNNKQLHRYNSSPHTRSAHPSHPIPRTLLQMIAPEKASSASILPKSVSDMRS
ncbi:hypothetical protein CVT25_005322 [Psilocybe cyanescens]|uniref:Uncharacterized protein n=1 Tax=Psilocybe cyanescens TaxID=93625 RepID=A0A409VPP5_PSICY|nr:hypothetical protein CVT25_005322 [Psilocybe cyanescens]